MTASLAAPDFFIETDNPDDIRLPAFSDEALALEFAQRHADDLRYVAAWGRWLHWDQKCWRSDDTLRAFDRARAICRRAAVQCNNPKIAAALASAKTVAAVERLAKADRRLAATADQWDVDPWLLNTTTGVVNLRTGKSRPHQPHDYMTKLTGVAPDASSSIATWLKFLDRIMGGNPDLVAFLQRLAGYVLTGLTLEHALFFLFGTGANGKTTFINAITSCLGEYHRTAPIETFTDSKNERHPTDLASLRGARLVTACASRLIVASLTRYVRAKSACTAPSASRWIASWRWWAVRALGRPNLLPRAFARFLPSSVRARMSSRSNSAKPPRTVSISRPCGVNSGSRTIG